MSFLTAPPPPPPKIKMGKKKSDIYSCFQILPVKNKANKSIFMCKFCDRQYLQNATKMESHIVTQCQKVPPQVRISYAKVPGGGPRLPILNNANTPTITPSDNTESPAHTPVNLSQRSGAHITRLTPGLPRGHLPKSNSIVIKRAGGSLQAHQIPRVSPALQKHDSLLQPNNSHVYPRKGGQKRPKLEEDEGHQLQNNHKATLNNNYVHRQGINRKRGLVGRPLNNALSKATSNNTQVNPSTILDIKEMEEIWKLLAKGIYATGCPLSILENQYWIAAFKKIQPAVTLPTTHALSSTLLGEEYLSVQEEIRTLIGQCNFVTLQCESHPGNASGEKILSFFVTTPAPILYRTLTLTAEEMSTKEKLCDIMSSTIDEIGAGKVLAFVSDLSPRMKSSWEILRSKYPGLLTFGCILEGLNTLLDRFLEEPSIRAACHKGRVIVEKTKGSSGLKKRFQEIQRQLKLAPVTRFKFSSKSKWSSLAKCLTLLISQKAAFQELIACEEAKEVFQDGDLSFDDLSEVMGDECFWKGMDGVTNIIVPLSNWIKLMELERSPSISQLPQIFHELKSAYENNLKNVSLDTELQQSFLRQLTMTRRLCMNELHYAACLLHPKLKSQRVLSDDEEVEGSEFIHYFCETRDLDAQSSLQELTEYQKNLGIFGKSNVWKLAETLDPVSWWNTVRPGSALATVAVHLLTIVPPLSTFDLPSRSGKVPYQVVLENDKVDKLAYIKHHLQHLNKPSDSTSVLKAGEKIYQSISKTKDWSWSSQPEFKLEDQEPMDVTQFLCQDTSTHPDLLTNTEAEPLKYSKKNNVNNNTESEGDHSILSNLMRGLPELQKDVVENEGGSVVLNNYEDHEDSSSDSGRSSSSNSSSSTAESTKMTPLTP